MSWANFCLILTGVLLNAGAQLLLKKGMTAFQGFPFSRLCGHAWDICTNFYVLGGILCYIFSVVIWLMVLTRVAVSVAYPMLSIGYIVTAIAGYYLFNEGVTSMRVLGIVVIMIGVFLVSKSAT